MKHQSLEKFQTGQLACSRQGRDKNQLYVVCSKDERWLYVADGRKWTVKKPKKKNAFHLQAINQWPFFSEESIENTAIIQAIETFERRKEK